MCKKILAILCLIALVFAVPALAVDDWICPDCGAHVPDAMGDICPYCGGRRHVHTWVDATCESPKTCTTCGETEGEALGHDWRDATCDSPKTCARCGATQGAAAGHQWSKADCDQPKTCAVCGATEGEALGHDWLEITCVSPVTCARCGLTAGSPLGHDWAEATYDAPKTCRRCGATEGEALKRPEVGDIIAFGHYPQTADGNDRTPIEWRVLEVREDGCAVLISEYGLDSQPYNNAYTSVTWKTCSLRQWLNDDFLNTAFTPEERAYLMTVDVTADANPHYITDPGSDARDRVYLLSLSEADQFFGDSEARACYPTDYAIARGTARDNGVSRWWLRTPGYRGNFAACINADGGPHYLGNYVNDDRVAVRPVIALRLD